MENILEKHPNIIISVIGPHAGEDLSTIFERKIKDITTCGYTYWICKSRVISPEIISSFQNENKNDLYMIFIKTSTNSQGKDTLNSESATQVKEKNGWQEIDPKLSPVTGKMPTNGFKFDKICVLDQKSKIDLKNYCEWDMDINKRNNSIKIMMGKSTICVQKSENKQEMKNGEREIVAYAKLADPFCLKFTNRPVEEKGAGNLKRKNKDDKTDREVKKRIKI